jgi:prepilin-type N-terminal cleavage/methylation domain-containing protein
MRRRGRAFTLVELLVVIGIIAILISVLIPALSKARQQANLTVCLANMRSLGQAINIYAAQNGGVLPYGYWDGSSPWQTPPLPADFTKAGDWRILLLTAMVRQSSNTYVNNGAAGGDTTSVTANVFVDRDVADNNRGVLTYGCHPRLMPGINIPEPKILFTTGKKVYPTPYKLSKIRRATEVMLLGDASLKPLPDYFPDIKYQSNALLYAMDHSAYNGGPGATPSYLLDDYGQVNVLPNYPPDSAVDMTVAGTTNVNFDTYDTGVAPNWGNIRFRHMNNTAGCFLMADGHAESHRFDPKTNKTTLKRLNINVNPNR